MDSQLLEQIHTYLPPYLLPEEKSVLFSELARFPSNTEYFLTKNISENILQGDGWDRFEVVNIRNKNSRYVTGVVLSNSCDIDLSNKKPAEQRIIFCPMASLKNYLALLAAEQQESIRHAITAQRISDIFYLPGIDGVLEESIILFDDIHSIPLNYYSEQERSKKFTLSQYGFYIFLIKLSIHFTRIQEGIKRFN